MPSIGQRLRHTIGHALGATIAEDMLEKAIRDVRERAQTGSPRTVFYDAMSMFTGGQSWAKKPNRGLSYAEMRHMSRTPIVASIIQTRINQIAAFCQVQRDDYELGFVVVSDEEGAKKETEIPKQLQDWIYTCGSEGGDLYLGDFIRKFMRDSLALDQACAEITYALDGLPAFVRAIDAATIRPTKESLESFLDDEQVAYVQVIDEKIKATYRRMDMIFGIRNPSTEIQNAGFGTSELELLVRTVAAMLNADKYNAGQLQRGGTQKGLLVVKGDAETHQFESFKRDFREAVHNAANFWRPPVLRVSKDASVDWVRLDNSNRDMEYAQLFEHFVKIACAIYQIDPVEVNWSTGAVGATTNFQSRETAKVESSHQRGLNPLLQFLADQLTHNIIRRMAPTYRLKFVGMDADKQKDANLDAILVTTRKTVNEIRADRGDLPVQGGDIILNGIYQQQVVNEEAADNPQPPPGADGQNNPQQTNDAPIQ
jgi:hypothetical protein